MCCYKYTYRVRDSHMNKAVHYSWAQLVHDLYHGFVIVLERKTFIESVIFITASYNVREFTGGICCISNHNYDQMALLPSYFHVLSPSSLEFASSCLIHVGNICLCTVYPSILSLKNYT